MSEQATVVNVDAFTVDLVREVLADVLRAFEDADACGDGRPLLAVPGDDRPMGLPCDFWSLCGRVRMAAERMGPAVLAHNARAAYRGQL